MQWQGVAGVMAVGEGSVEESVQQAWGTPGGLPGVAVQEGKPDPANPLAGASQALRPCCLCATKIEDHMGQTPVNVLGADTTSHA